MSRSANIPKDLKDEAIRRMLAPNNESPQKVAKEMGLNYDTVRHMKSDAMRQGWIPIGYSFAIPTPPFLRRRLDT